MACAAADASSTSAAFCCVTASIWPTAMFTCSMPVLCSAEADEISVTICVTRCTEVTMSSMMPPASCTSFAPASTRSVD